MLYEATTSRVKPLIRPARKSQNSFEDTYLTSNSINSSHNANNEDSLFERNKPIIIPQQRKFNNNQFRTDSPEFLTSNPTSQDTSRPVERNNEEHSEPSIQSRPSSSAYNNNNNSNRSNESVKSSQFIETPSQSNEPNKEDPVYLRTPLPSNQDNISNMKQTGDKKVDQVTQMKFNSPKERWRWAVKKINKKESPTVS